MTGVGRIFRSVSATAIALVLTTGCSIAFDWPWQRGDAGKETPSASAYNNPQLAFDQRANDLISRMTLEEKASQLTNFSRAIPRLGIPAYNWWSEALHGVANNGIATVFPQAIGLAATFDPASIHEMGIAISIEGRVKFNKLGNEKDHTMFQGLTFWSPNINIFRDPRWGRGQETYGEDPWLSGQLGKAFVTGLQGDDPKYLRAIATPKHYAVHSGPEPTRHHADVTVSKHDMVDTYLAQFRTAIVEGKAQSAMCAYNRINGQPACANDFLLGDVLRNAWRFNGYVVSDCDAIADIAGGSTGLGATKGHNYVKTAAEAAAVSIKHGVDNDCVGFVRNPKDPSDYQRYVDAVNQGLVPMSVIDESLRRLIIARMKLGLFDPKEMVPFANIPDSELDSQAHRDLALKLARESIVMLKNNGGLPIRQTVKRIALVGPLADRVTPLLGNYNGTPSHAVTALEGLKKQFPNAEVVYEPGTNFLRSPQPVPNDVLSAPGGRKGLLAEVFANGDFMGAPIDAGVVENKAATPNMGDALSGHLKSVRWTSTLIPTESGTYMVGLSGWSGRLLIDGKEVVLIRSYLDQRKTAELHLNAGQKYVLTIENKTAFNLDPQMVWLKIIDEAQAKAVAAARSADVVVAVVGITSQLEGEEMPVDEPGFKGGDRTSIDLPNDEEDLLKAVRAATKRPMAVVLYSGSALAVNWADKNADAIIEAWYGGEEAGTAIAETLAGINNPSGRLPVTFYTGIDQLPPFEDYSMANRTYRYFKGRPLYPFGYGLSYTTFGYSGLKLSSRAVKAGDTLSVAVDVKNNGEQAGDEVVQLYLTFPKTPGMPIRALRGVQRVSLQPGEIRTVHFDLMPRDLSSVTEAGDIKVQPGKYRLSVGGGQPGTTHAITTMTFAIDGEQSLPQ